jgi:hypothetical protein
MAEDKGISTGAALGGVALILAAGAAAAYHWRDQIFGPAAVVPPPGNLTPDVAAVAAVIPPVGTVDPTVVIVRDSHRLYTPGATVTTMLMGGKHSQLWSVGGDGETLTRHGAPFPATPASVAQAKADHDGSKPAPRAPKPSTPPATRPGTPPHPASAPAPHASSPASPLAGLPLPPAAQQAVKQAAAGLPPQATQAIGAATKLLGQGGASSPLGQASSALSGLLGGGGKGGGGASDLLGGASGGGSASSGGADEMAGLGNTDLDA